MKKPIVFFRMNPFILSIFIAVFLISCKGGNEKPDVSGIPVNLVTQRFEEDLFAIDTNNIGPALQSLQKKYPGFLQDFMANILGIPAGDPQTVYALKKFITDFKPIKKATDQKFGDFNNYSNEVKRMLQYTRYYFPEYSLPAKLITYIGPMDAFYEATLGWTGDIITTDGLGVGLQLHLGGNSPFYSQEGGQGYPDYIARRFEPAYIPVNCAKNIIDDLYPDQSRSKTLVEQMVDKGKRLYILDKLLPDAPDTLKIGYTANQLAGCIKNEGLVWNLFTENSLLYETDFQKIKSFISEGPRTMELGDDSPGYITLFTGWQIVKAYMKKNPETTPKQLISIDNKKLFEESKYKPK
jgi:hypothetical protein